MALDSYFQDLLDSLKKVGIGPGSIPLIPADFKPTIKLDLKFGDKSVELGNFLKTGETKEAPSLSFTSTVSSHHQHLAPPSSHKRLWWG